MKRLFRVFALVLCLTLAIASVMYGQVTSSTVMDPAFAPAARAKSMISSLHAQADNLNTIMFQTYDGSLEIWKQTLIYTGVDSGKPIKPAAMTVDEQGVTDYMFGRRKDLPGLVNYSPEWYKFAREQQGKYTKADVMPPPRTLPPAPAGFHYTDTPFGKMLAPDAK